MGFRDTLRNHVSKSTLDVMPRMFQSPTRPQKLLWIGGALFGLFYGGYILIRLFLSYYAYHTFVSIGETNTGAPFPDVTVCNLSPLESTEQMSGINLTLGEYLRNVRDIARKTRMDPFTFDALLSQTGYLQNIDESARVDNHTDLVVYCNWKTNDGKGLSVPCRPKNGYYLQRGGTDFHTCVTFHTDYQNPYYKHATYGLAMMLYLNDFADTDLQVANIDVHKSFAGGVRVLLHSPNTLPVITLNGMNLPPGQEITISYSPIERHWMNYPYGYCTDRKWLDEDTKRYAYSQQGCGEYLQQYDVIKECDALHPLLMTTKEQRENYPYCGRLLQNTTHTVRKLRCCLRAHYESADSLNLTKECPKPCLEYRYETEMFALPWPHESYQMSYYRQFINNTPMQPNFAIYEDIAQEMRTNRTRAFERMRHTNLFRRNFLQLNVIAKMPAVMRIVEEKPAMTGFSLMGEIGGACSLWMGISILTLIELIDLIYQLCLDWREKGWKLHRRRHCENSSVTDEQTQTTTLCKLCNDFQCECPDCMPSCIVRGIRRGTMNSSKGKRNGVSDMSDLSCLEHKEGDNLDSALETASG